MKTAIVYASYHHHNTEQIARAIAPIVNGNLYPILTSDKLPHPDDYDMLAIGSGIYKWSFHPKILSFVEQLPDGKGTPVMLFSTSSFINKSFRGRVPELLKEKGYHVLGYYQAKGSSDFMPEWLLSSRHKGGKKVGRPNETDIRGAVKFAQDAMNMLQQK